MNPGKIGSKPEDGTILHCLWENGVIESRANSNGGRFQIAQAGKPLRMRLGVLCLLDLATDIFTEGLNLEWDGDYGDDDKLA